MWFSQILTSFSTIGHAAHEIRFCHFFFEAFGLEGAFEAVADAAFDFEAALEAAFAPFGAGAAFMRLTVSLLKCSVEN